MFRLVNVGGNTSINLEEVQLQYWFDASLVRYGSPYDKARFTI
jgi:hypothetical protein